MANITQINVNGTTYDLKDNISGYTTAYDGTTTSDTKYGALFLETLASGVDTVKVGLNMDLLWTNSTPTSSFSAQTISLDLSEYRLIFVVCKGDTGGTNYPTALADFNTLTQIGTFNGYTRFRAFTATATGVQFGGGYKQTSYSNDSSDNSATIPYKIYGIR